MTPMPTCVIVTGRPGSGKTTLSKLLGRELFMPVISRDEIKEGYVNTAGVRHDQLPATANGAVTELFFELVCHYLAGKVSVVIEAAFQHTVWAALMPRLRELSAPSVIVCSIDAALAAQRHLQRGLADPRRELYHGDARVASYRATGEVGPPGPYVAPAFSLPTLYVATEGEYRPSLSEIVDFITRQPR